MALAFLRNVSILSVMKILISYIKDHIKPVETLLRCKIMWELKIIYKNGKIKFKRFEFESKAFKFLAKEKETHKIKESSILFIQHS
jgi:hypothetical protein